MTARRIFAALYFLGMTTGLAAGMMLPWWISGAPAWALAWVVHGAASDCLPHPHEYMVASPQRISMAWARDKMIRSATAGAFIGALSGALAADLPELYERLGSRPPDGHLCGLLAVVAIIIDARIGGAHDGDATFRPGPHSLMAYAAFLALVFLPALVEASS